MAFYNSPFCFNGKICNEIPSVARKQKPWQFQPILVYASYHQITFSQQISFFSGFCCALFAF